MRSRNLLATGRSLTIEDRERLLWALDDVRTEALAELRGVLLQELAREYMRPALKRAKITKPVRVWHDLQHTSLTHEAAAGNPQAYVQLKAGHSQGTITERYIHAAQVPFPGAASRVEERMFGAASSSHRG